MWANFGQLRGSTGFNDNLAAAYDDGSGVHLTQAGVDLLAQLWRNALMAYYVAGSGLTGLSGLSGRTGDR
jgi:hypothetical protein